MNSEGQIIKYYGPRTKPDKIRPDIEKYLWKLIQFRWITIDKDKLNWIYFLLYDDAKGFKIICTKFFWVEYDIF